MSKVVGSLEQAAVKLTEVGRAVKKEIFAMEERYPQVKLLQYQIMPDHVHLIMHVKERLPEKLPLGNVVAAWKQLCGKAYSALLWRDLKASQRDGQDGAHEVSSCEATFRSLKDSKPSYTPLFSKGFNDRILTGKGQLSRMIAYVKDNPRRFLIKQQHRGFFTIHRDVSVAGMRFDAVGNLALLQKPIMAVHCRRRWSEAEQAAFAEECLCKAEDGAVLVGAFISKAEKEIAQKAKETAEAKKNEEAEVVLKVGDTVCIEEMQVVGEIMAISDTDATILFDSIRLRTSPDKLRKVSRAEARKTQRRWQNGIAEDLSEKAEHFDLTLDVRGKRAEEALDIVDKYLDEAKLLSIKEVSILHGKGNGILRKLIREKLSHNHDVERFCDASLETGGTGITRVYFR